MDLWLFGLAGFLAQMVDGALGMAYGVTCNSILLALGYPPAVASASVHAAEVVTSGISGHFHFRLGNVDRRLFRSLVWPGMIGGALGAYALASLPGDALRPWVAMYLALMGIRILIKAWTRVAAQRPSARRLEALGFAGGLLDAIGGGGWGPIVTSTLIGRGHDPRFAIGSVNRAEFFVTLVESAMFLITIGLTHWRIIIGLCLGGALAAPIAARVTRRVPRRAMMVAVGLLVVVLSLRTLLSTIA
jgi:uncharacterized membrane protein YfcA